jgi:hypothetical protein
MMAHNKAYDEEEIKKHGDGVYWHVQHKEEKSVQIPAIVKADVSSNRL